MISENRKGLALEWASHLKTKEEKEEFEKLVRNSHIILSRVSNILDDRIESLLDKETREKNYDSANWSHLQAHRNGHLEALQSIRDLFNFLKT